MKLISDPLTIQQLNDWARTFVDRIKVEMHNQGLDASGRLSDSLEYTITDTQDGTHIQVLAAPYFFYAEKGRKSGKTPFRFGDILAQWVLDKGINIPSQFKNERQFGYAIARPLDVVSAALDEYRPKLNEILENRTVYYINDNLYI